MSSKKLQQVIIDTDPGVDDALAIMVAHNTPVLQVKGITTVFGNHTIEKTTKNACTILDIIGVSSPVYRGASRPLAKEAPPIANSHGETGLGGYRQSGLLRSKAATKKIEAENAIDFLARAIVPGTHIACLGPTTNLALLANLYPNALRQAKALIIMGGAFNQPGNTGPWAEYNVFCDPDALAQLLNFEDVPKVLIPADVCRTVTMDEADFTKGKNQQLNKAIRDIIREYVKYYKEDLVYGGSEGGVMYDTLVIAYLLWPELFNVEPKHVVVETGGGPARGATAVDPKQKQKPNCLLVTPSEQMPSGVNSGEIKERLLKLLT